MHIYSVFDKMMLDLSAMRPNASKMQLSFVF